MPNRSTIHAAVVRESVEHTASDKPRARSQNAQQFWPLSEREVPVAESLG
jgi:hypothetical protein